MSEFRNEFEGYLGKGAFKFLKVASILAAIYILSALVFGLFPFSVASGVVNKVVNSTAIINNYQWFYDQYNTIQAQQANYESVPVDAYERNGMRMVLNNSIAEYNSRSKQITRNLWKADNLPYQINLIGGGK
jgi:hypothetical protein